MLYTFKLSITNISVSTTLLKILQKKSKYLFYIKYILKVNILVKLSISLKVN